MDLSVIIVNYKSPQLILSCLETIYNETKIISFEIIIVDNDSKDDSRQIIQQHYPNVQWIQMDYNSGFARANNAGIRNAKGEFLLLLNSDTLILENALDKIVSDVRQDNSVAAASVQLLYADYSPQNAGNYFVYGGVNVLLTLPVLNYVVKGIGKILKLRKPSIKASDAVNNVDWISGAFMLVRKSVLNKAGMMDEDFFLFSEEIEWCSRLKNTGRIAVYTDLKVIHLEGGTTKNTTEGNEQNYYEYWTVKGRQLMVSNLLRIRKQYSIMPMFLVYIFYVIELPILFFAAILSAKYNFKQVVNYFHNILLVTKFIPKIISNKPYFYKVM
ncbi:MAG TPA: glycosyltransferase family 2 protein [Chitinophagales bacterium]|jgi:GT2 family glycosyltransferase|nr:glycosyltransferase family 2 protein [Chitinophagales bacterium]